MPSNVASTFEKQALSLLDKFKQKSYSLSLFLKLLVSKVRLMWKVGMC